MTAIPSSGGATALLEPPVIGADSAWDEFELDVRVVVSPQMAQCGNCPTDDGCGNTCKDGASTCTSESNNSF